VGMGVMDGWVVESGAGCSVIEGWVRVDSGRCDGSGLLNGMIRRWWLRPDEKIDCHSLNSFLPFAP
jgi:hypothetical protein